MQVKSSVSRYPLYWFLRFDTMAVRITDWCSPGFMRQGISRLTSSFPNWSCSNFRTSFLHKTQYVHTKKKQKITTSNCFQHHLPPPKKKSSKSAMQLLLSYMSVQFSPGLIRPYSIQTAHSSCPVMVVRLSDRRCGRTSRTWLNCWRRAWRRPKDRWRRCWTGVHPLFSGLRLPIKGGVSSWQKKNILVTQRCGDILNLFKVDGWCSNSFCMWSWSGVLGA